MGVKGKKRIYLNPGYLRFNPSLYVTDSMICNDAIPYVREDLALNEEVIQKILDVDDRLVKEMLVDSGRMPGNSKAYCRKILSEVRAWYKNRYRNRKENENKDNKEK